MSRNSNDQFVPEIGSDELAYVFDEPNSKYNDKIKLEGRRSRVYCKEPYAQEDVFRYLGEDMSGVIQSKDLKIGDIYKVKIVSYNNDAKLIKCEENVNGTNVYIPIREYSENVNGSLVDIMANNITIDVIVIKDDRGSYYGSVKRIDDLKLFTELEDMYKQNTPFEVKIMSLVKGGYIAMYKNVVRCFIPGAHAAPNIILDFSALIGKTLPVMVDNYDSSSKLFIVSYKKYIKHTMPERIHNIEFGRMYTGMLTSKPTEFGIFVEFEEFYTGLIYKTEFQNYGEVMTKYRPGDKIDFYVKNVIIKKKEYRIILTLIKENVDQTKLAWTEFKNKIEGNSYEYYYDKDSGKFSIIIDEDQCISINVTKDSIAHRDNRTQILVRSVDIINQNVVFDFV